MRRNILFIATSLLIAGPAFAAGGEHTVSWMTMGAHAFNLILLLTLLVKFAKDPAKRALQAKADGVTRDIDEAAKLQSDAQALLDEFEGKMAALQADRDEILSQYRQDGEADKARIIEDGRRDAERILREAKRSVANELVRAKATLEAEVVDLAIDAATAAIKAKLGHAEHRRLTADYLGQLEASGRA